MELFRKSPCGYNKVLLFGLFLDDTGLALAEEALVGLTSLAESGVPGVLGIIDRSNVEVTASLEFPTTIAGVRATSERVF
jgi:hypothetical protein